MTPTNEDLDALDVEIEPHYSGCVIQGLDTKDLYTRPGKFIPVVGDPRDALYPFRREGQTVYMTPKSAHYQGVIGCARYQWLRLKGWLRGLLLARPRH